MSQFGEGSKTPIHRPARDDALPEAHQSIDDGGQNLAQQIRDLYASGAKLFIKDAFRQIEAALASDPKPDAVMVPNMNGGLTRIDTSIERASRLFSEKGPKVHNVYFKLYQDMLYEAELNDLETRQYQDRGIAISTFAKEETLKFATCALSIEPRVEDPPSAEYALLKSAWDEARNNWNQSVACRELIAILSNCACTPKDFRNIVCFGLGNLEGMSPGDLSLDELDPSDGLLVRSAMTQHAAALTMAAVLGERFGTKPLPILLQDPDYSAAAKQLLENEGMEVLGGYGSLGFTHVDDHTVVFSCCPNIPVKQIVADIARPAAMIWDWVAPATEGGDENVAKMVNGHIEQVSHWITDEDSPRTRKLVESYDKYNFPSSYPRFSELEIYIRKD